MSASIADTRQGYQPPNGAAPKRIEGRDKVTGRANYTGDLNAANMGFAMDVAVAVTSAQATGQLLSIDTGPALASPGVRAVLTHENAPRLHKVLALNGAEIGDLLPLQDGKLSYSGQCVAVVVADTLENAQAAALLVCMTYSGPSNDAAFNLGQGAGRVEDVKKVGAGSPGQVEVGHPERAYEACPGKVDLTFTTPPHHHNAIEPGAVVAAWDEDGRLTVHVPTQFTYGEAMILGQAFGFGLKDRLPRIIGQIVGGFEFDNKVRVICPLVGGGFGGKNGNVQLLLAPMAAKLTGRPVKLVLSREQTFSMMPFRGETRQCIRIAATPDGMLEALIQDAVLGKGTAGQFVEPVGESTAKLYDCKNMRVHQQAAALDTNAPGWMRGPGVSIAQFAVESAVDALAHSLGIDPLDFRLRNHADVEPDTGHEWSSKSLRQCYEAAGRRIGWFERNPAIGSMREGRHLVGYGMATAIYPTLQMPSVARITLDTSGHAVVQTATHEVGQGMITAMTQVAAEGLGLDLASVRLEWGDSRLPFAFMTVGSMTTLSVGAAVAELVKQTLFKRIVKDHASPLHGAHRHDLAVVGGRIVGPDGASEPVADAMARGAELIEEEAVTGRMMGHSKYGRSAFGAQFAKVLIDPQTAHIQVEKLIGAFAGGRAINPMLVRSQLIGGMVWGVGQALHEETQVDIRSGAWMNANLGEALVPTNADIAVIDAIIVDEDDTRGHPLGVKGMGEIGTVGVSAAIANAVFHATGRRLLSLPIRTDSLLGIDAAVY